MASENEAIQQLEEVGQIPPATEPVQLPPEIQFAMDNLRVAREQYDRIRGLIEQAKRDRDGVAAQQAEAFKALAEDEAGVALDGSTSNPARRRAALKAQEGTMLHDARITGLQGRQAAAREAVDSAMRELSAVGAQWQGEQAMMARDAFWAAVQAFVIAASQPIAAGIGLGDQRLSFVAKAVQIPDAEYGGRNAFRPVSGWRNSPGMLATVQKFGGIKTAVTEAIAEARLAMAN